MSNRIVKVWGLLLAVMLIATMLVPARPAAAVYGQQQFLSQTLPTATGKVIANGSDIRDIAQGTGIIWVTDGTQVYQSTNNGGTWTAVTGAHGLSGTLTALDVAPDNTAVVAVTNGTTVAITTDSGATWTSIGVPVTGGIVKDIAIAPARSGTLLGREYIVAVADNTTGVTTLGQVMIIGGTSATWAPVGPSGNLTGQKDWVAVAVGTNFVGDRSIVAIGAAATPGPTYPNGVEVVVVNTASNSIQSRAQLLSTTATTSDSGNVTSGILRASISLPSDFDATTSSGRRAYVGFASSAPADNDVYRVDDNASKALGGVTSVGVASVAYAGTVGAGTLFLGRMDTTEVKYTTDMTSGSPTWTATKKVGPQNGAAQPTVNIVQVARDFATSRRVYLGNSGSFSAFNVSTDGGISFNPKSFVDTGVAGDLIGTIRDHDFQTGKIMVSSRQGSPTFSYLWQSTAPTGDNTWSLLWYGLAADGRLERASDLVWYFYDKSADGNIYRTSDGGATWNTRMVPSGFTISEINFQDENVGWITAENGNNYKTTNGGFIWTSQPNPDVSTIAGSTTGRTDELIFGGTGAVAISKDGGASYTKYNFDASVGYNPTKDSAYTTNNILYFRNLLTNGAERWTVGVDAKPVSILNPIFGAVKGLNIRSGVMYVFYGDRVVRSVNYSDTIGTINWNTMTTGAVAGINSGTSTRDVNNIVYFRTSTAEYAYEDVLGTAKPVVNSPSNNGTIQIDPNSGEGRAFQIILNPVGIGTALADQFQVEIAESAAGFAAATRSGALTVASPATPALQSGAAFSSLALDANKSYIFRVRAVHSISGETVDSPWSATQAFTVASGGRVQAQQFGPQLLGPTGTASTTPGFAWVPIFGATKYRIKIATDAALAKTVEQADVTLPSFQPTKALSAGTTYFFSVQVIEPTAGPVSVGTFTTAAAPPKPVAPPTVAPAPAPAVTVTVPPITIPPQPTPTFTVTVPSAPAAPAATPGYIWAVIIIGAILVIAVIVLIVRTRKTP